MRKSERSIFNNLKVLGGFVQKVLHFDFLIYDRNHFLIIISSKHCGVLNLVMKFIRVNRIIYIIIQES